MSFQEAEGCQEFWYEDQPIVSFSASYFCRNELHEIQNTLNSDYYLDENSIEDSYSINNDDIEFPAPSLNNIDAIMSLFDLLSPLQAKIMANAIVSKSYLPALFSFFKSIDLSQTLALKKAFYILKKLCMFSLQILLYLDLH